MRKSLVALLIAAAAAWASLPASAQFVLRNGPVSLGVSPLATLISYDYTTFTYVGVSLAGVGDAVVQGVWSEGWGVSAGSTSGWASYDYGLPTDLTLNSFYFDASTNTAISVAQVGGLPLEVTHRFVPSPSNAQGGLFEVIVTLRNLGTTPLTDLRYVRVVDWDVPPTPYYELITVGGLPAANVYQVHNNGFSRPDPLVPTSGFGGFPETTNVDDFGPDDQGVYFQLRFGDLPAGASRTFSLFYGAAYSEAAAMGLLAAVGAEVYSLAQPSSDPTGNTFILAFKGVGGTPLGVIPEPTTLTLLATGLVPLALRRRRA